MAIKFTAKDQPKAAPAAAPKKADARSAGSEAPIAAPQDAQPAGNDLFDAESKPSTGKRKPK
jgi:hypothetical protein